MVDRGIYRDDRLLPPRGDAAPTRGALGRLGHVHRDIRAGRAYTAHRPFSDVAVLPPSQDKVGQQHQEQDQQNKQHR